MVRSEIQDIQGFQIFDSRGWPTLAVEVMLDSGEVAMAQVPAGASTGSLEVHELRDGGKAYSGRGVSQSVQRIKHIVGPSLKGYPVDQQDELDRLLIALDGTPDRSRLGANTILGVSLALSHAAAQARKVPLYEYWSEGQATLPTPQFNVINGGQHADSGIPVQEFLLIPGGASSFADAMRMGTEVYHALQSRLRAAGYRTAVGDEGGFAPQIREVEAVFQLLLTSIDDVGLHHGDDIALGIDVAANSLREGTAYRWNSKLLESPQLIDQYADWVRQYPSLISIEDGLAEDDWTGWANLTARLGQQCQVVGDDIFVTHAALVSRGITDHTANAVLIKLNQIGTVTETKDVVAMAQRADWNTVVSHRSGETVDSSLADFAVARGARQVKAGAPARGERLAKYNRLLLIEAHDAQLPYAGWSWRSAPSQI